MSRNMKYFTSLISILVVVAFIFLGIQLQRSLDSINQLKVQIDTQNAQVDTLTKQVNDLNQQIQTLNTQVMNLNDEKTNLLSELDQLKQENEKLKIQKRSPIQPVSPLSSKTIYLTFDDGPSSQTQNILSILKQYQIKATFFVTGKDTPNLYQQIVNDGHTLALHTYTHDYATIYQSADVFFNDLYTLQSLLESVVGFKPMIFRFAGGSSNSFVSAITLRSIIDRANSEGFIYYDWNCDSSDSSAVNVTSATIIESSIQCYNQTELATIMILLHDTNAKQTTVDSLSSIIEYYQANQFSFLPITPTTPPIHHCD